jgi:hypothetical protein
MISGSRTLGGRGVSVPAALREGKIAGVATALDRTDLLAGCTPDSGAGKSLARSFIDALRDEGWAIIRQRPYHPGDENPDTEPDADGEPEPETIEETVTDVRTV